MYYNKIEQGPPVWLPPIESIPPPILIAKSETNVSIVDDAFGVNVIGSQFFDFTLAFTIDAHQIRETDDGGDDDKGGAYETDEGTRMIKWSLISRESPNRTDPHNIG